MTGSLSLVIGPMASGKTSHLMREISRFRHIGKTVMIVNHDLDTRFGRDSIFSHDGHQIPCRMASSLLPLIKSARFQEAHVIVIEEVQFFHDAFLFCSEAADSFDKHIIAAGLQGTRIREPWPVVSQLVPIADHIHHLKGLCMGCRDGTLGSFTKRLAEEVPGQTLIGDMQAYACVCRNHYTHSFS